MPGYARMASGGGCICRGGQLRPAEKPLPAALLRRASSASLCNLCARPRLPHDGLQRLAASSCRDAINRMMVIAAPSSPSRLPRRHICISSSAPAHHLCANYAVMLRIRDGKYKIGIS